jgi:FixJ family two-component response regulator
MGKSVATEYLISIVDDDDSVREGLTDLLASVGYPAAAFASAEAFLASGAPPLTACLITDGRMSGMGGLELFQRLTAAGLHLPTILITAFPSAAERGRAMQAGMHCYLPKPCNERELLGCLRSAVASRGTHRP